MSQNALKFEKFLKTNNMKLEKIVNEDLTTFLIRENIENAGPTTIGVLFNSHDGLVNIVAYQFLRINKPEMKQQVMELINTLNVEYTFCKYVEKDDFVTLHISVPFKNNFRAELLSDLIATFINTLNKDYPRFMAILGA
ncbi:MAG: hypothetical protein HGB32_15875 [Geobacteraceae bacterium]|nr:hypothetical protein [Geobacteraceae bacterium]NTW81601.1 hypothetical protein [Geobacteraceae bacterium]